MAPDRSQQVNPPAPLRRRRHGRWVRAPRMAMRRIGAASAGHCRTISAIESPNAKISGRSSFEASMRARSRASSMPGSAGVWSSMGVTVERCFRVLSNGARSNQRQCSLRRAHGIQGRSQRLRWDLVVRVPAGLGKSRVGNVISDEKAVAQVHAGRHRPKDRLQAGRIEQL
jgi:hypothetical protein